ncbi:MAG: hypothetical protein SFZ24_08585 [Planctomycetota bacterium]|nr:hypothetical protein [Planctomycetota bacterium]
MVHFSLTRAVSIVVMSILAAGGGYLGYRMLRSEIAAEIYRDRLASLARDYEGLREQYNEAVRQSAVTELVVEGSKLRVALRDRSGTIREVETPVDPSREVYVDYAVVDGRLLIRRVFDAKTPPEKAFVLDEALSDVNWNAPGAGTGKAVYRTLEEGRWVVSVTGNGALGLVRSPSDERPPLVSAPQIRTYEQELKASDEATSAIGWRDIWHQAVGRP